MLHNIGLQMVKHLRHGSCCNSQEAFPEEEWQIGKQDQSTLFFAHNLIKCVLVEAIQFASSVGSTPMIHEIQESWKKVCLLLHGISCIHIWQSSMCLSIADINKQEQFEANSA